VVDASELPRDSQEGSTLQSSGTVTQQSCKRPIFHRPFLDDHLVTSSATSEKGDCKVTPCLSGNTSFIQTPDRLTENQNVVLKLPVRINGYDADRVRSPVIIHGSAEAPTSDGRLSAALGLISLAARTELPFFKTESSIDRHPYSPPAGKRPRLESLSDADDAADESHSGSSLDATKTHDSDRRRDCSRAANCVIGKKFIAGGNETSFSWPGIEAVIGAYMQHLQEERDERQVLSDRQLHLTTLNQQLAESASQLELKVEEAKSIHSELVSRGVQLQTAIDSRKNCTRFTM
jgi:hypothetical protein